MAPLPASPSAPPAGTAIFALTFSRPPSASFVAAGIRRCPPSTWATCPGRHGSRPRRRHVGASASGDDEAGASGSTAGSSELPLAAQQAGGACPGCGRESVVGGCNGEGRIQGGIGAFPGFGWWPIKAFRPCPAYLESGGRYKRIGQSLNEVAFGTTAKTDDLGITERLQGKD